MVDSTRTPSLPETADELAHLRAVMNLLPIGVLLVEGDRMENALLTDCNPAYGEMVGCEPRGVPPQALPYRYFRPDRTTEVPMWEWPAVRALSSGRAEHEEELHLQRRDGRWLVVSVSAAPVRRDGAVCGAVVLVHDISRRKRAEQELRQSEERFRALADNAPDVIWRLDRQLRHVYMNAAGCRVLGLGPEQVLGRTDAELGYAPELDGVWEERGRRIFATGEPQVFEFQYAAPTGPARYEARLVPERGPDGGIVSLLGVARDITERARAHERLRALQEATAALSQARTPAQVAEALISRGMQALGADAALMAATTDGGTLLQVLWSSGLPPEILSHFGRSGLDTPLPLTEAVREGREVVFETRAEWAARYPVLDALTAGDGRGAVAAMPLRGRERVLGGILFVFKGSRRLHADELAFMHAITEQAALALERAEAHEVADRERAKLEAVVGAMGDGLVIYREGGRIELANPAARRLLGLEGPLVDRPFAERLKARGVTDAEGRPFAPERTPTLRALQGETVLNEVICTRLPDGRTHRLNMCAVPVRAGQRIERVVATLSDVTQLHELQRERAELAARLEATIGAMTHGVVVYAADGRARYVNPEARKIFGKLPQRAVDSIEEAARQLRVQTPDGEPMPYGRIPAVRALRGEVVRAEPAVLHRADGTRRHVLAGAAPIADESGRPLGAVMVLADTTELHELQERQEDLLRTISHDLRTPLSVLLLHAQAVERRLPRGSPDAAHLAAVVASAARLSSMIGDLVEMVRLESGQIALQRRPLPLRPWAQELLGRLAGTLETSRVRLEIPPDLPPPTVDAERLERVVVNLLSNALKYSPPDAEVVLAAAPDDGGVRLSVTDRGIGIPPEEQSQLFERFYRARAGREREGLGLGLYIASLLVKAHGGRIEVQSAPGRGSTFAVRLPGAGA